MTESIIAAMIAGICMIAAQLIIANRSAKDLFAKLDKQSEITDARLDSKIEKMQAVTDEKLENLTREVRKHNGFAERIPVLEEKIKVANRRLEKLEKKG